MTKLILVRITCPSRRVAEDIADAALEARLAACANLEGPVSSTYRWKGVIEQSFEFILWLKAPETNWAKIEALVDSLVREMGGRVSARNLESGFEVSLHLPAA